jgi:hypothetical protein
MDDDLGRLKQVCDSLASRIGSEHEELPGEVGAALRESLQNLLRVPGVVAQVDRAASSAATTWPRRA